MLILKSSNLLEIFNSIFLAKRNLIDSFPVVFEACSSKQKKIKVTVCNSYFDFSVYSFFTGYLSHNIYLDFFFLQKIIKKYQSGYLFFFDEKCHKIYIKNVLGYSESKVNLIARSPQQKYAHSFAFFDQPKVMLIPSLALVLHGSLSLKNFNTMLNKVNKFINFENNHEIILYSDGIFASSDTLEMRLGACSGVGIVLAYPLVVMLLKLFRLYKRKITRNPIIRFESDDNFLSINLATDKYAGNLFKLSFAVEKVSPQKPLVFDGGFIFANKTMLKKMLDIFSKVSTSLLFVISNNGVKIESDKLADEKLSIMLDVDLFCMPIKEYSFSVDLPLLLRVIGGIGTSSVLFRYNDTAFCVASHLNTEVVFSIPYNGD